MAQAWQNNRSRRQRARGHPYAWPFAESVSLYDRASNLLFAADVLYPGPLYARIPNANLPDYLATAERLIGTIDDATVILCGHGDTAETPAPRMARQDLCDIRDGLRRIRDGAAKPISQNPLSFPINARMTLLASEASFGTWQTASTNI